MLKYIACVTTLVVATGCTTIRPATIEGNKTVASISEAATLTTSITSITPWSDIKEQLRPGFELKPDLALTKSLPMTLSRLNRVLEVLRLQVAVNPAIVQRSSSTTTTSKTGEETVTASEEKTTKSSPDAPKLSPANDLKASDPKWLELPDSAGDAMLQYQAAANLLREIAVLNAEIDNVAARRNQDAYLARIQVTVAPRQSGLGYNVVSHMSIFGSDGMFDSETGERHIGEMLPVAAFVVPILSTDAVQGTRRQNSQVTRKELGAALNILRTAGALGTSLDKATENESEASGAELESVVTTGRAMDSALRVRLGADPLPGGGYGMTTRNFHISAVIFLPKKARQLSFVARLSLFPVMGGAELARRNPQEYESGLLKLVNDYKSDFQSLSLESIKELDEMVLQSEYRRFSELLRVPSKPDTSAPQYAAGGHMRHLKSTRQVQYIWTNLVDLNSASGHAFGTVDLPRQAKAVCPDSAQIVAYKSDNSSITINLGNGKNLRAEQITSQLLLGKCAPSKGQSGAECSDILPTGLTVPTSKVTTSADGQSVSLQFPAVLTASLVNGQGSKLVPIAVELDNCEPLDNTSGRIFASNANSSARNSQKYTVNAILPSDGTQAGSAAQSKGAPAIQTESKTIFADQFHKGVFSFSVQGLTASSLSVKLNNATVIALKQDNGTNMLSSNGGWPVSDGMRYIMSLGNLNSAAPPHIELYGQLEEKKAIEKLITVQLSVRDFQSQRSRR